ncbi:glycosyl hydrolase family 32 [Pengzhenrongella phosphoraccumulans]|uniref:glycosyl hydrolase family 32 n=1 Tax=Pengzhenrongella phosphoraccumulans TaxID=3114394 RepID=UPI003890ED74
MLRLPYAWTWDFWCADDGEYFHLFFLKASRALGDPNRRHWRATVGHAISTDLKTWTEVADALVAADGPAFDDLATWTGSVVRGDDGVWRMFYTGVDRAGAGMTQRIGTATSPDLYTWTRSDRPPLEADPRWYEKRADQSWPDEAWRDPWVMRDPAGDGWHMLTTARSRTGAPDERGVIGHATSTDLETWTVRPPHTRAGAGFGQLEVTQVETVEGRTVLIFCCLTTELSKSRRDLGETGGIWAVETDDPLGPYDVARAYRITDEAFYAGRLVQDRAGSWFLLAFHHSGPNGAFIGELSDPMAVRWSDDGRLCAQQTAAELAII